MSTAASTHIPAVGDKAGFLWSLKNVYYPGIVAEEQGGSKAVVYDDGGRENFNFQQNLKIWLKWEA